MNQVRKAKKVLLENKLDHSKIFKAELCIDGRALADGRPLIIGP